MSAKPRILTWSESPGIVPEARALLGLADPPDKPVEFQAFLAGMRDALGALSPNQEVRFLATPITSLLDSLAGSILSEARGIRTQWDQDPLRGHGSTAYRAFAQPAPKNCAAGYACLKAVLLGLLLIRSRDRRTVSLEVIEQVVRFIRLGSDDVHVDHEHARTKIIASLPPTFVPSQVRRALAQRDDVPDVLHPRLTDIERAVDRLAKSFSLIDRGAPNETVSTEPTLVDAPTASTGSPAVTDRPIGATHDRLNGATCRPRKTGLERGSVSG